MNNCVTRFSPSPSGKGLHLGSIRSCLFSYLVARQNGGRFHLRIENTSLATCSIACENNIIETLRWLGLEWDNEVILRQSERFEIYQKVAHELVEKGFAYKCFCTPERVDSVREKAKAEGKPAVYDGYCIDKQDQEGEYVIRFRTPTDGVTVVDDLVLGELRFDNASIGDFILLRSNGEATYLLANTYDDVMEGVNVIYRGNDGASGNLPRQVMLREALSPNNEATWGHCAMVLGPDNLKLSKSNGAPLVLDYKAQGYLPEALLNCLFRLGAGYGNKEIFSKEEMIELFNPRNISKSDARFDPDKLDHWNAHYLKNKDLEQLTQLCIPFFDKAGYNTDDLEHMQKIVQSLQSRSKTLVDLAQQAKFYYEAPSMSRWDGNWSEFDLAALKALQAQLSECNYTPEAIEAAVKAVCAELGVKLKQIGNVFRLSLTGSEQAPSIYEIIHILGKEEVDKRLTAAINLGAS